ncbi:membrane protein insertase YidC [Deminuibacter soli]|uniref:Membrane protein insertase YidC n=1 Tax=Deminuibacter soli TaxID=2291815 RepID=A0A3E1NE87_9BACT|nr:membrane protein insertase YidC [Deminuibacter soli]RFM26088.1 membrane protein insertase YidC [Deminuibacter soli]
MKTDKNTIIGFVLLGVLFFAFFWYTNKQQQAVLTEKKRIADSTAAVIAAHNRIADTAAARVDSLRTDSLLRAAKAGNFTSAANGTEQLVVVENSLMKATFTNKGGQLKSVELKKYRSTDSTQVIMGGTAKDNLSYNVNTSNGHAAQTSELFFNAGQVVKNADGSQAITFTLSDNGGESITHQYIVKPDNYLIDWNVSLTGADKLLNGNSMNIAWDYMMQQQQASVTYERQQSRVCFVEDGGYDYKIAGNAKRKEFEKPTDWVSIKQQFFNVTLVAAKNKIQSGATEFTQQSDSSHELFATTSNFKVQVPAGASVTVPFQLYFGPNDYYILKKYDNKMENIVDLGSGIFSFVKYINRWIIMPVFNFFAGFIGNYGWVIALLTLFIRIVISPLTYSSYVSGAKMKLLRPELDVLKKKFGSDQQGFAMEQMKLFREAGVNPLGGCIPALLQIPIFFALSSFFSANILLRGQSFLWAKDLSASDMVVNFHRSLPLIGDHISLFTITAIITSFLISIYNMSMTPTQDNPAMKYMPYIFPFILFFVFNNLSSALTWYYTVSNLVTLALQFVIQHYIIDHDKIMAKIEEKRKAPKTQSKFQERYSQMMEAQKKVQDLKNKTNKK